MTAHYLPYLRATNQRLYHRGKYFEKSFMYRKALFGAAMRSLGRLDWIMMRRSFGFRRLRRLTYAALCLSLLAGASLAQNSTNFISIGTGGVTGVYYPTGGAICRLINKGRNEHGIRCSVESTGGSVYNINTLRNGELDFGIAQSDWQYHAFNGTSRFAEDGQFEELRSVFSVHSEPVTIVARRDADISHISELQTKRVNIGNPGSGNRAMWEMLETAFGWQRNDFSLSAELKSSEMSQALCDNQIDAFLYQSGHPSGLIMETLQTCDAVLVDVTGPEIDSLVQENSYFRYASIDEGVYGQGFETFGLGATLVTTTNVPDEVVYQVVKSVFDHFDDFRNLHPAFRSLLEEEMVTASLSAPLHDGARRFYAERGWIDEPTVPGPQNPPPVPVFDMVVDHHAVTVRSVTIRERPSPNGRRVSVLAPSTTINVVGQLKRGPDGHGPYTVIEDVDTGKIGYIFGEWSAFAVLEEPSLARGPKNMVLAPSGEHAKEGRKQWARKFAIVIGVSDYEDLLSAKEETRSGRLVDLSYAEADANAFIGFLREEAYFGGDNWEIFSLIGESASAPEIKETIAFVLDKARADDLVYFFFAGHGRVAPTSLSEVYLMAHDTKFDHGYGGVEYDWILGKIGRSRAGYVFGFVDACRSGTIEIARGSGRPEQNLLAELSSAQPTKVILTAGTGSQQAHEDDDLGHGVFTYYLLKGLKGNASDNDNDGLVDLSELANYVTESVARHTRDHPRMSTQTPRLWDRSGLYPEHLPLAFRRR